MNDDTTGGGEGAEAGQGPPPFILYQQGDDLTTAQRGLVIWVHNLLLPVYAGEESSRAPWCPRWWEHPDAVAHLYGLWMAWQEMTSVKAGMNGPAMWHRDFLGPAMTFLRDPSGPFSGCKPGSHRPKDPPRVDVYDG
ncbi:DUF4913 domain-containing protein [Streptomyces sp. NPDC059371]|uniref:DUF4913 domain-containing protein n=1 Tax=Streptomyces sp. NPDC059371 TaxID=3346812 RepID=UPI0036AC01E4